MSLRAASASCAFCCLALLIAPAHAASGPRVNSGNAGALQPPVELTAEQDHARLLHVLGIRSLRPGADPRDPNAPNAANYDESRANPEPHLPDPLRLRDGERVTSAKMWWTKRRPEIVAAFDREVYGRVPADVPAVHWQVLSRTEERVGDVPVVTKRVVGHVDNSAYPLISVDIELSVTTPAAAPGPVPVVMQLTPAHRAREAAAVKQTRRDAGPDWREQILRHGWGFALLIPTSIQADDGAGLTRGIIGLVNEGRPRAPQDWGALRAWAWGASRALDYLETDTAVDAARVAIEGLSRYGKAALLAMAYDTRFAAGFIASSGAGGAKLLRRDFGERLENLASAAEYHWMAGNFLKYAGPLSAKDLPVDAHELIALCAPRPVFLSVGAPEVEGGWVDARGMFRAAVAAGPVYELLGRKGLGATEMPARGTALTDGEIGFRQHHGGHTAGPNWPAFLQFASRYLDGGPGAGGSATLLNPLFQDHAVLQRDRPIAVWGWNVPGEEVTVTFAGAKASARTDASGRWQVSLPAQAAGGPYELSVRGESGIARTVHDVLVGDVWLCSGQSNMVLQVKRTLNSRVEIAESANDSIRMLTPGLASSSKPLRTFAGPVQWQPASPATVPEFSATCFYFARELQKVVHVPMGLINSSWGGSSITAWMSEPALRATGEYADALALLHLHETNAAAAERQWGHRWEAWWRAHVPTSAGAEPWGAAPSIAADWPRAPRDLPPWEQWGVPELASYDGVVWYRTTISLDATQAAKAATLSLGPVDEVDETWVNGKPVGYTSGPGTDRLYALPSGLLHEGENTIAVAALDTYGAGGLYGPAAKRALKFADGTSVPLDSPWRFRVAPPKLGAAPRAPWEDVAGLATIYNAMIAPVIPYTLRGVLWYQGASDAEAAAGYGKLLSGLMADWRGAFGAEMPFLVVQLANYGPAATAPTDSQWARLREEQRLTVAHDAHAALAVAVDIGDRYDIHPANKQELGRRLARAARHLIYGEKIPASGPVPLAARREGERIVVTFGDLTGHLVVYGSDRPVGFELCAADQASCRYADARAGSDRVWLDIDTARGAAGHPGASGPAQGAAFRPTRVRFCWADSPVCNLYDESGLPAGPFEIAIH